MGAPMVRLADRIRSAASPVRAIDPILYDQANARVISEKFAAIRDSLRQGCPVIVGDAVAEWYYNGTDQERWHLDEDFPGLVPPFRRFWIEWARPSVVRSREFGIVDAQDSALPFSGIYVRIHDPDEQPPPFWRWANHIDSQTKQPPSWSDFCEGATWIWEIHPLGMTNDTFITTEGMYLLAIDGQGKHRHHLSVMGGQTVHAELFSDGAPMFLYPGLMSIVFMNLKNGTLTPAAMHAPEKFTKNFQRKHDLPLVRYHTVIVDPTKTGKPALPGPQTDRAMPVHLVRGHLVTYADEDGKRLFGKYAGTYFRPPHVRGSAREGISLHDYHVKAGATVKQERIGQKARNETA